MSGNEVGYTVTRLSPVPSDAVDMREPEFRVSGADHFQTAYYEVSVTVGSSLGRGGLVNTVQGVAVRVPVPAR